MRFSSFILLACCWLLGGCEDSRIDPPAGGDEQAYFPLSVGQVRLYEVDSIVLIPVVNGTRYDTARLLAREILVDTFIAPDGQLWYRGERYEKDRDDGNATFRFKRTFSVSTTARSASRREDNLNFIKLVFPQRVGEEWAGNADFDEFRQFLVGGEFLDIYAGWSYRYTSVGEPRQLSTGLSYERTTRVEQAMVDNLIDYRQAYEIYAEGVGLIESFVDARHTQCQVCCNGDTAPCVDLAWDEKAEKGFILHQRLTE